MADRVTVYPDTGSSLVLTPADHLATGGEGVVYLKGDTVYKVYLDSAKAMAAGLDRKVAALAPFRKPGIAAPTGILRDKQGRFIGLSLPRAKGDALCRYFTNTWRDSVGFGLDETRKATEAMRAIVGIAHAGGALLVDANEMNWLLDGDRPTVIDVDSWQLPGFPATAIMPSVRDHSQKGFSEGSDWFAWAVVTFQLWTGVHPFKGTHPVFGRGALEERMKAHASVFDAGVRLPPAARPIGDIPPALRDWYARTFGSSERSAPPANLSSVVATQTAPKLRAQQTMHGTLKLERLGRAGSRVYAAFNGFLVAKEASRLQLWDCTSRSLATGVSDDELQALLNRHAAVVRAGATRVLITLDEAQGVLAARDLASNATSTLPTRASALWQSGNRVFARVEGISNGLQELDVTPMGATPLLAIRHQWPINVLSSTFHRGIVIQDCLGTPFLATLEGAGLRQGPAPQLVGYRVVEGVAIDGSNIVLTARRRIDGETVRLTLAWRVNQYEVQSEVETTVLDIDAATAPSGVGLIRDGEDLLVVKGETRRRLENVNLPSTLRLFGLANGLGAWEDGEVLKLSMTN